MALEAAIPAVPPLGSMGRRTVANSHTVHHHTGQARPQAASGISNVQCAVALARAPPPSYIAFWHRRTALLRTVAHAGPWFKDFGYYEFWRLRSPVVGQIFTLRAMHPHVWRCLLPPVTSETRPNRGQLANSHLN